MAVELALNQEVATVVAPAPAQAQTKQVQNDYGGYTAGQIDNMLYIAAAAGVIMLLMMR